MKRLITYLFLLVIISCTYEESQSIHKEQIAFEKISYYHNPKEEGAMPFQYKITYYFDNGKEHRWLDLDSSRHLMTDYINEYDNNWNQIGARYREPGDTEYAIEKVRFKNDSTKITEWIDSIGQVYYTMTDNLNTAGRTYRATFQGDVIHGYDTTLYTSEGFVERIFFKNKKGTVYNDRSFAYDSINDQGDWIIRKKIMNDTIRDIQYREIHYDRQFVSENGIFYDGAISTGEYSENTFSFNEQEDVIFLTRTLDWDHQIGYLTKKEHGLFTVAVPLEQLDTIYNGAISLSGDKIIYTIKSGDQNQILLLKKEHGQWSEKINLSRHSNIQGGYFHWFSDTELYFYILDNGGDIVKGILDNDQFSITDSLYVLNSKEGTEFSPFIDAEKQFIIFTRYQEGDTSQQGFFVSYNSRNYENPNWTEPAKIESLPYGWNARIIDNQQFIYTNGEDIMSVPLDSLQLNIN